MQMIWGGLSIIIARLFGYDELADAFTLDNATSLATEVNNKISIINLKNQLENAQDMSAILNMAMDGWVL